MASSTCQCGQGGRHECVRPIVAGQEGGSRGGPPRGSHKERLPLKKSGNYEGVGYIVLAGSQPPPPPITMKLQKLWSRISAQLHSLAGSQTPPPPITMKLGNYESGTMKLHQSSAPRKSPPPTTMQPDTFNVITIYCFKSLNHYLLNMHLIIYYTFNNPLYIKWNPYMFNKIPIYWTNPLYLIKIPIYLIIPLYIH